MSLLPGLAPLFNAEVTERGAEIEMRWSGGELGLTLLSAGSVFFSSLRSSGEGTLTDLISKLPAFLRERGYSTAHLFNDDPAARTWIEAVGFQPASKPGYYDLDIRAGGRADQYAAWKRGDGPEPDWHRNLT